ncbi:MAG: KH domain-containing protein [Blastocatellia bacterium]|nr:KH domain-containing protein [Blastocatellia bacterium]MBK6428749.1 KH domain-containing protein [Blastocatellia bacterium]
MRELVEVIAKALVDFPDEVKVNEVEGQQTTVLELRVAPADLGKVIGKQGRTARAVRTILGAAGMKLRKRFVLEILE